MRLLVLSDTHFEFHKDHGEAFVNWIWEENKKNPPDAIILAGDISDIDHLRASIKMFAEKFEADILFVLGNHEPYNTTPQNALRKAERVEEGIERVYWLEPEEGTYLRDNIRIHGGTLWFEECEASTCKQYMNDFQAIHDFEPWVYEQNKKTVKYLAKNVKPGDIVVTHHMPSEKSVHPWYAGSPTNAFFVCDIEWIITSRRPSLFVHGHTHLSCKYKIGDTQVICNPFGYARMDENKDFNPRLIIEV